MAQGQAEELDGLGNVDDGVGEGGGLTSEMLYGDKPETTPTDKPAAATLDKPAGEKPDGEKPKGEEPPAAPWDKDRQRADQANANLRRDLEAARGRIAELEKGKAPPDGTDIPDAKRELEELETGLSDVAKEIEALDDLADASEMKALLLKQNGLLLRSAKLATITGQSTNPPAASNEFADDAREAFAAAVDVACKEVGEEHRNTILLGLQKEWSDRGFSPDSPPTPLQVQDIALSIGRKAFIDAGPTSSRSAPKVIADSGTGGSQAAQTITTGQTMDEAVAEMTAQGKFG